MQSLEEKLTTKWYRDYSHKLHIQRLQEIKSHASKRIDNSVPKTKDSVAPQKKGKEFLLKEKKKSITRNNQQLLKILTEITAGKRETATQKILNSTRDAPLMKSLNLTVRKKEVRRIDEDNEELVKRLNEKKPEVSFKRLQEEWGVMNKYRESISKRGCRNESRHLVSRLPPMEEFGGTSRDGEKGGEGLSRTLGASSSPKYRKKVKALSVNQSQERKVEFKKGEEEREIKEEDNNKNKIHESRDQGGNSGSIKLEDKEKGVEEKDRDRDHGRISKEVKGIEEAEGFEGVKGGTNEVEPGIKGDEEDEEEKKEEEHGLEKNKESEVVDQSDEQGKSIKNLGNREEVEENSKSSEDRGSVGGKDVESKVEESKEVGVIDKSVEIDHKPSVEPVKTPELPVIPHHEDNHEEDPSNPASLLVLSGDPPQINPLDLEAKSDLSPSSSSSSSKSEIPSVKASNSSSGSLKPINNEPNPQIDQKLDEPTSKTPPINEDSQALELNP